MATKKRARRSKCSKKKPCKASARSKTYLGSLGRRTHKARAKSRGKRAKPITGAQAVRIGRKRLASIRKYSKKNK